MTDWLERVDRTADRSILVEHALRYRLAAPAIAEAAVWLDLGCGNGDGALIGLGESRPRSALLVDSNEAALATAARQLAVDDLRSLAADLASAEGLEQVGAELSAMPAGPRCVTAFEVVEHLERFAPLVSWLVELGTESDATVLLSVPNDAETGVENPFHLTKWGEGAVDELRSLLPEDHVLLEQAPLGGSAIVVAGQSPDPLAVEPGAGAPSHFILGFGPLVDRLRTVGEVVEVDIRGRLAWERQREADLAYFRRREEELRARLERDSRRGPA